MGAGKCFSAQLRTGEDPARPLIASQGFVDNFCTDAALDPRAAARLSVVVEEVLANALRHGGARSLAFELQAAPGGVSITFTDDGKAFDPTAERAFDGPDAETGGGVGLALLRSWASKLSYVRDGELNRLSLLLKIDR